MQSAMSLEAHAHKSNVVVRVERHVQLFRENEGDELDRIPLDLRQASRSPPVAGCLSGATKP